MSQLSGRTSTHYKFNCFYKDKVRDDNENTCNLVPRVLGLFGQRLVTRRDSGPWAGAMGYWNFITAEFLRQNNANRYGAANQKTYFFPNSPESLPRVSPGAHPLTKMPEDSGYEIDCGYEMARRNNSRRLILIKKAYPIANFTQIQPETVMIPIKVGLQHHR